MKVIIIKYNAGNIRSVDFALRRMGVQAEIADDAELILSADKVIFPGVGEASTTMDYLRSKKLDVIIKELRQPVLGICLGLQLMCTSSEEGSTQCLDIFNEPVRKFVNQPGTGLKIPHMGWNFLNNLQSPLFEGTGKDPYVYFVHSYYAAIGPHTIASTNHIVEFSAALKKDNFYATQFHPEKSGGIGARILENFIRL